ncbi:hypothetical protein [Streptoalloteichus hindustanus]|uniref:Uncharacterized protein n=1 Tax=Streptoalloteichus hindustanus TaxID=2017 RepID=A0A1M4ZBM1_STRHI|nr:hypothetical protein [Streptoalloteichus hindustanus]SHF15443.1 hypothetical protein SAMN05444320_102677 [Streptoalloteichus hindustanus]
MTSPRPDRLRQRLAELLDTHLEQLQRAHIRLLALGPASDEGEGEDVEGVEEVLVTSAILAQQFAKDTLALLGDDFDTAAVSALRDVIGSPETALLMPDDVEALAALRADAAALLAAVWVAGELTALVPPSAWPEDLPALCLATVTRSRLHHQLNDDLAELDHPNGQEDDDS